MLVKTQYVALTEDNFNSEVIRAKTLVLVDCWASWCHPFRQMNPVYDEMAITWGEHTTLGRLNIAIHEKIAAHYGIRVVPTLLIFRDGKIVERIIGTVTQQDLSKKIGSLLAINSANRSRIAYL
jgi:thioredoxin